MRKQDSKTSQEEENKNTEKLYSVVIRGKVSMSHTKLHKNLNSATSYVTSSKLLTL